VGSLFFISAPALTKAYKTQKLFVDTAITSGPGVLFYSYSTPLGSALFFNKISIILFLLDVTAHSRGVPNGCFASTSAF